MSERRLVVDRLEGDLAVVEVDGGAMLDLPRWMLPEGCREADVVRVRTDADADGTVRLSLRLDRAETASLHHAAEARLQRLRARDPGGDVQL